MINRPGYLYFISFTGEGTIKTGDTKINDNTIREFIYFWIFDLKLLPKKDSKKSIIKELKNFNNPDNKYLGTKVNLSFIATKFPIYEYLLNSLRHDIFVSNKDKKFVDELYNDYMNRFKNLFS